MEKVIVNYTIHKNDRVEIQMWIDVLYNFVTSHVMFLGAGDSLSHRSGEEVGT